MLRLLTGHHYEFIQPDYINTAISYRWLRLQQKCS